MVRPLFESVLPEVEKLTVSRKVNLAERIGDAALVALVKKDAPWNPVAKGTLISQGPEEVAELMNSLGVDAKHGRWAILAAAVGSIVVSDRALTHRLEEMAKRHGTPTPPAPAPDPA